MATKRKAGQGSEKRQRDCVVQYRTTAAKVADLRLVAADRGLTLAAYLREREEGTPGPRPVRRRLLPDERAIRELMVELNRVGNNLNQIARAVNIEGDAYGIEPVIDRLDEVFASCLAALGKPPP